MIDEIDIYRQEGWQGVAEVEMLGSEIEFLLKNWFPEISVEG